MKTTILLTILGVLFSAANGAIWNCGWDDRSVLLKSYSMGFNAGSTANTATECVSTLDKFDQKLTNFVNSFSSFNY